MNTWRNRQEACPSRTGKGEDETNSGKLGGGKLKVPTCSLFFLFLKEEAKLSIQYEERNIVVVMAMVMAVLRTVRKV